jgi:hypothetical protein
MALVVQKSTFWNVIQIDIELTLGDFVAGANHKLCRGIFI